MMRSKTFSFFPALIASSVTFFIIAMGACTDAGGKVSGGEPEFDAATSDSGFAPLGTGTNFTDLYKDYFGPTGRASCAGNNQCHGAASQPGAQASGGYVCPPDATTIETCRTTMMQFILVDPTTRASTCGAPFNTSYMYTVIRKTTHGATDENNMPLTPFTYTFTDSDVARINTWVTGGCQDD